MAGGVADTSERIKRVLIVEDTREVADLLRRGLTEEGFDVEVAATGKEAIRLLQREWDIVVLDLMLPDIPGSEILTALGSRENRPPVLVLSARGQLDEKLRLFELGCDDYVVKPFAFPELLHRVRALLRRPPVRLEAKLEWDGVLLDASRHVVSSGEESVTLTPKESDMLRLLMREPDRVIPLREMLFHLWGYSSEPNTNFLQVHVANLRRKLSQVGRNEWIRTVRKVGLTLSKEAST